MTSSKPDYLLKVSPPNTITIGWDHNTWILGENKHSVHAQSDKQRIFSYSSRDQKSKISFDFEPKSKYQQSQVPPKVLREVLRFLLQISNGSGIPWLWPHHCCLCLPLTHHLWPQKFPLPISFEDRYDCMRAHLVNPG